MSFRILAFDTSTKVCSVALMINNDIRECFGLDSYKHEREILSVINKLLSDSGITLQSLDCLVCSCGPGSFVGVRVGISLAQGLSLGTDVPLVQVSSLEILSESIWRLMGAKLVLSTMNARLGELYLGCYSRQSNGQWLMKNGELIMTPVDMCRFVSKLDGQWVLVGTGWNDYPILFDEDISQICARKILSPSARDMLPFAVFNLKYSDLLRVDQVQPIY